MYFRFLLLLLNNLSSSAKTRVSHPFSTANLTMLSRSFAPVFLSINSLFFSCFLL
jgi:hypothetical protein